MDDQKSLVIKEEGRGAQCGSGGRSVTTSPHPPLGSGKPSVTRDGVGCGLACGDHRRGRTNVRVFYYFRRDNLCELNDVSSLPHLGRKVSYISGTPFLRYSLTIAVTLKRPLTLRRSSTLKVPLDLGKGHQQVRWCSGSLQFVIIVRFRCLDR